MSAIDSATIPEATPTPRPERIQNFIFGRELAEVYLLLDHVSGRSDKSLAAAFGDDEEEGKKMIADICNIGWPPTATPPLLGQNAATLLMAKDRLNHAATPANGASIAFSLLVAGDDELLADRTARRRARWRRSLRTLLRIDPVQPPEAEPIASNTSWAGEMPSRMSLARRAYPGLVATSGRFNRRIKYLIILLFVWLIFTCLLSWNIAAGRSMLVRLDAAKTTLSATDKRIGEIESSEAAKRTPTGNGQPTTQSGSGQATAQTGGEAASRAALVQRYCEHARSLPPLQVRPGVTVEQFETAAQYQICDEHRVQADNIRIIRGDLAIWLNGWSWVEKASNLFCGSSCLSKVSVEDKPPPATLDTWAAVLAEILATAVLPICYGFLGAGAAVVRSMYAKMRESLLSPRDLTLAWGQLALGAVIGACIGLFVSPTSGGAESVALISGASTLSLAALSFIAGFGVESVFIALESLIRRIFNVSPQTPRPE